MKKEDNKKLQFWALIWFTNAAVLYLASLIFPSWVVFGNVTLPGGIALVITSLILTLLLTQVMPAIKALKLKIEGEIQMGLIYGVVNIVGLWLWARGAVYTGFGISSVWVAITLGVILTLIQWKIWKSRKRLLHAV